MQGHERGSRLLMTGPESPPLVDVSAVRVIGDHRLRLTFMDGVVGDVSFEDRGGWSGMLAPLSDPAFSPRSASTPRAAPSRGPTESTSRPSLCTGGAA